MIDYASARSAPSTTSSNTSGGKQSLAVVWRPKYVFARKWADRDPEATAHFLANTYFGLQTTAKLCLPPDVFEDVVDGALRALA